MTGRRASGKGGTCSAALPVPADLLGAHGRRRHVDRGAAGIRLYLDDRLVDERRELFRRRMAVVRRNVVASQLARAAERHAVVRLVVRLAAHRLRAGGGHSTGGECRSHGDG